MPVPFIREPLCQKDIIYFLLTDRFFGGKETTHGLNSQFHRGNFSGLVQKIPYLVHLGITVVWITPVYLSIGNFCGNDGYHGYWAMDFDKIDPRLTGSHEKSDDKKHLAWLADCLHENGIKLVLDMVVNHTGYHTPEYRKKSKIPAHWFKPEEEWDLFGLPKLNHKLADVRDYFVNNIVDWIEQTRIDAIRMDSVPHVDPQFWYYFKAYVRGKYRNVFFLGEDLNFNEEEIAIYQKEHDFDSLFDFPLRRNIVDVLIRNEDFKADEDKRGMTALASPRLDNPSVQKGVLDADAKYNNANRLVTLLDNHDLEKRIMSWALEYAKDKKDAAELVKYALTFQFTVRGIPQIYYGTEIGMEGDQKNGGDAAVRKSMEWWKIAPSTNEPFEKYAAEKNIYAHLRKLISIRRENEALCYGYQFTLYSSERFLAIMREFRGNTIIAALNNESNSGSLSVDVLNNLNIPTRIKDNLERKKVLINLIEPNNSTVYENGKIVFNLQGKTAVIYRLKD